jgi:hypothetical protein
MIGELVGGSCGRHGAVEKQDGMCADAQGLCHMMIRKHDGGAVLGDFAQQIP